jgi:hypothetical protein
MTTCSRLLGVFFVLIFLLSAPAALILFNLDSYVLSPEPYIQALDEEAFRERLPAVISSQIRHSLTYNPCLADPGMCDDSGPDETSSGPPSYLSGLTEDGWQRIFNALLDPAWMQSQTEAVLQAVFHNLEPGVEPVPIQVSLTGVKTRLAGEAGLALVRDMLAAQPACTLEQVQVLLSEQAAGGDIDGFLACSPPDEMMAVMEPELRQALALAAAGLPESVELEGLEQFMQFSQVQGGEQGGPDLSSIRLWMRYSPLIPLLCILLIILFSVRSIQDLGRWVGLPLFVVGLSMSAIMFLLPGMLDWVIDSFLLPTLPGTLSTSTSDFVLDFARGVGRSTSTRIGLHALLLFILGGVLVLVASLTHRRRTVDTIPALTRPRGENQGGG